MRVNRTIVFAIAALLILWGLGAEDEGIKIGIIDLEHAMAATEGGKAAREELEGKQRSAEERLRPMMEEFEQKKAELEKSRITKSTSVVRDLELDVASLQSQLEITQAEMQSKLRVDYQRIVGPLQENLLKVVNDYGRSEGFTIILRRAGPSLVYAREALDITEKVIKLADKES